jgi:hypothetical protein
MRTEDLPFLEGSPRIDTTLIKILRIYYLRRVCTPDLVAEIFAQVGQEFSDSLLALYQFSPDELPVALKRLKDNYPSPPAFRSIAEMQRFVTRYSAVTV